MKSPLYHQMNSCLELKCNWEWTSMGLGHRIVLTSELEAKKGTEI